MILCNRWVKASQLDAKHSKVGNFGFLSLFYDYFILKFHVFR